MAYTLVGSITEGVHMDAIAKNARMDITLLKYDEDGCLLPVEK